MPEILLTTEAKPRDSFMLRDINYIGKCKISIVIAQDNAEGY